MYLLTDFKVCQIFPSHGGWQSIQRNKNVTMVPESRHTVRTMKTDDNPKGCQNVGRLSQVGFYTNYSQLCFWKFWNRSYKGWLRNPNYQETFFNMIKTPTRNHSSVIGHPDSMCDALRLILRVPTRHKAPVTVTPVKGKKGSSSTPCTFTQHWKRSYSYKNT